MKRRYNVLFLSRRNSARSVIAEALLNQMSHGKFIAYSAGVEPADEVDPDTLELLTRARLPVGDLRPQGVRDFMRADAPEMDFIFTLSDERAGESTPSWPGQPITAHWGVVDPWATAAGSTPRRAALEVAMKELERRLRLFSNLRFDALDRLSLQRRLDTMDDSDALSPAAGPRAEPSEMRPREVAPQGQDTSPSEALPLAAAVRSPPD